MTEEPISSNEQYATAKAIMDIAGRQPPSYDGQQERDAAKFLASRDSARDAAQDKTIAELEAKVARIERERDATVEICEAAMVDLDSYSSPVSSEEGKSALRFAESSVSPDWGILFYAYKDLARLLRARTKEVNDLAAWGAKQREIMDQPCGCQGGNGPGTHNKFCHVFKALALPIPKAVQAVIESRGKK